MRTNDFFHRSASSVSLLGDYDRLGSDGLRSWSEKDASSPRPGPRRKNMFRRAVSGIIAGAALSVVLLSMYRGPTTVREEVKWASKWTVGPLTTEPAPIRKALVSAGTLKTNFTWEGDVPADWEFYKYIADDPYAQLTVPRNQGREAMVYLTYIIDHYDDLPDYMVFVHGHEKGWHQPEPIPMIVRALNLEALDDLDWVSLRCQNFPSCTPDWTILWPSKLGAGGNPDWIGQLFVGLHSYVYRPEDPWFQEIPEQLGSTCCAQFAVTKKATLAKPLEYWKRLRAPLMRDVPDFLEEWQSPEKETTDWHLGVAYERGWHWFFGKESVTCYSHDFCRNTIFRNKIHCDGITTDWPNSQHYESITCEFGDAPPRIVSEDMVFEMDMQHSIPEKGPHGGPLGEVDAVEEGEVDDSEGRNGTTTTGSEGIKVDVEQGEESASEAIRRRYLEALEGPAR